MPGSRTGTRVLTIPGCRYVCSKLSDSACKHWRRVYAELDKIVTRFATTSTTAERFYSRNITKGEEAESRRREYDDQKGGEAMKKKVVKLRRVVEQQWDKINLLEEQINILHEEKDALEDVFIKQRADLRDKNAALQEENDSLKQKLLLLLQFEKYET
jgi:septal ring factor EnvC (AmiA/AmiB activator)